MVAELPWLRHHSFAPSVSTFVGSCTFKHKNYLLFGGLFPQSIDRALSFSPVVGTGTPHPSPLPQASVFPPPLVQGRRYTLARGRGGGGPNSDEGTDIVVLYAYMHFVVVPMPHFSSYYIVLRYKKCILTVTQLKSPCIFDEKRTFGHDQGRNIGVVPYLSFWIHVDTESEEAGEELLPVPNKEHLCTDKF